MKLAAEGAMLILNLEYKVSGVSKNRVALAPVIRHARAICGEPTYPHPDRRKGIIQKNYITCGKPRKERRGGVKDDDHLVSCPDMLVDILRGVARLRK